MRSLRAALAAAFVWAAVPTAASAQSVDVIRGRVTGPDSLPIDNATVVATTLSGNVSRTTRTDRQGRYTITFPGSEGDYIMTFNAIGYTPRRFEVKRVSDEDVLIADARMQQAAMLDAVEVRAARDRPRRNDQTPDVGGTERTIATSEIPANLMGDLAAMAATLPGVMPANTDDGSNGYSVLGLGADQNTTTLNGMSFGGANLPRDASVSTSLSTSPYDVSRGGFSGAQMNIRARSGSNFITRSMSVNFDNPLFQWTDAAARTLGQEYGNTSFGGGVSGPIVFDKTFFNTSFQAGRRSNDFQTLETADVLGLKAAGVVADSADRLLLIMQSPGLLIPAHLGQLRDQRHGDNGSVFGTIDLTSPTATSGKAVNLLFNGSWGRQSPAGGAVTETPGYGGDRTNWRFGMQGRHSNYFGIGVLTETSVGFSASKNYADPFLDLPAGRVRVTSQFPDSTTGVTMLSFGGNQTMNATASSTSTQAQNQLSWFSANNKHRLKLTSDLRYETASQLSEFNTLGTFTYNSLADLEANAPVSFSRALGTRNRDVQQIVGGVSLGDSYRRSQNLQLTYGLRVDASQYLTSPTLNPAIETLYRLRNDELPNRLYVSPRIGFSWSYGTAAQIGAFAGAFRGPRAVVRGGIGVFQNLPGTGAVGSALDNTGLPSAVQQITCVGTATPVPNWPAYKYFRDSIPTACAGAPSVFGSAAPNVTAFSSDYFSPRSVRGNIQWSGPVLGNRFNTSLDLTGSLNLNQSSSIDRNFDATQRFALPAESNRPVYVLTSSIVPATGAIASQGSRKSTSYNRVNELVSDLQSRSYQATLRVSPMSFSNSFTWSAWYVYSAIEEQFRGFNSTVSNPLNVEWGRSAQSPHQLGYTLGYNFFDFVRVNWFGQFRSGNRYTPMVAGDVNGDGAFNDRAFLFPATTADTGVANGMQALLSGGSSAARACLSSQLGQLAARNTCQGPWTSTASLSISFNPLKVRLPQRASLTFQLSNPLYAADLLVNGSGKLRGWGQMPFPDNQLLYVRGFDAATSTYKYEVNRRFGATNPAFQQFRAPVTLTAMLRVDVGPTRERQMLTQQLDRGRRTQGAKAPELMLRAMFGNGGIPNPMAALLRDQDTLKLTSAQADSIATMNRQYIIRLDAIWSPIVKDFAVLPDNFEHEEAYQRYIVARRKTVDTMSELAPHIKGLLTAEQYRRIPPFVASYLDVRYLASIRSGTAGFGGGPGGFMPAGADGVFTSIGAGGGMEVRIIRSP